MNPHPGCRAHDVPQRSRIADTLWNLLALFGLMLVSGIIVVGAFALLGWFMVIVIKAVWIFR